MANGPRRVGLQQNTALETLERVLGIGQGIAQNVQANRDRRARAEFERQRLAQQQQRLDLEERKFNAEQVQNQRNARAEYLQKSMQRIMGNTSNPKYSQGILSDKDLNFYKTQLEQFEPLVMASDINTIDMYNFFKNDLSREQESKEEYSQLSVETQNLNADLLKNLDEYQQKQDAIGTEGSEEAYNELNDIFLKFAKLRQNVYFNHENKIKLDTPFSNRLKSIQTSLGYAMSEIIGNDQRTSPEQYEAMTQTLITGNPIFTENFILGNQQNLKNKIFNLNKQANNTVNEIDKIKNSINESAIGKLLIDPSSPNFEKQLKKEFEEGLSDLLLELDIDEDQSFENVKQQYKDAYQETFRPVKDAEANLKRINAEYKSVNPQGTGIPGIAEDKDIKTGPLPIEIVDDINNNIVKKVFEKNPLFKNLEFNNILEAKAIINNMVKSAPTKAEKNNIIFQYHRVFSEIDSKLQQDKRLQKANRAGIGQLYNNKIQRFNLNK